MSGFHNSRRIALLVRVALGAIFCYAGIMKVQNPRELASTVASFDVLPAAWVTGFAAGLPFYEAIAGIWLLLGWRSRIPALAILILCVAVTGAAGQAWLRGLKVSCACFGNVSTLFESPPAIFGRGLGLAVAAGFVYRHAYLGRTDNHVFSTKESIVFCEPDLDVGAGRDAELCN